MYGIGIVGTGISALHLALQLQQRGISTTLYADKSPEQIRAGRLPNNVCRFGRTRAREHTLGVDHWNFPDFGMNCAHVRVHTDPPIAFCGNLSHQASYVDFRLYLPRLLADYQERGGTIVPVPDPQVAVSRSASEHDSTVVATGHRSVDSLFPRIASRSAEHPARLILAGLFHGVAHTDPLGMHFEIVPGAGEIFQTPVHSVAGRVAGITFEAVCDGPWANRLRPRYYDDPSGCARVVLELLREVDSEILGRLDTRRFALTRPLDLLQGAITPTVRRPWTRLGTHRFAIAVGDAAVLNDPVTGQGANLAVAAAWELGRMIDADTAFDEQFCHRWEERLWDLARDVTEWTGSALGPPPDHVIDVLRAAADSQDLADTFLDNFDDPPAMWSSLATAQQAAAFIRRKPPGITQRAADLMIVERERRLLDLLGHADSGDLLAPDALLVTAQGCHTLDTWPGDQSTAGAPASVTEATVLPLSDSAQLITYRHRTLYCSTLWHCEHDNWAAVVHHRSPAPMEAS
ncbi:monooxygenase [Nocardia vinacea]|uniref:styrene monooxygenase/indole monooxygenase family protein n=1 Tax=Nocardia vinacea TaxID=96468 RepID=UPI002E0D3DFC|nr:monooxygenase [Nocardia vinacea]